MLTGNRDEPAEKLACRVVLHEVVSQNSGRLLGIDFGKASRLQMSDDTTECSPFTYKSAILGPRDEIDMNVDVANTGYRRHITSRFYARNRPETASGQERHKARSNAVPRRNQNRKRAAPEEGGQPLSAGR